MANSLKHGTSPRIRIAFAVTCGLACLCLLQLVGCQRGTQSQRVSSKQSLPSEQVAPPPAIGDEPTYHLVLLDPPPTVDDQALVVWFEDKGVREVLLDKRSEFAPVIVHLSPPSTAISAVKWPGKWWPSTPSATKARSVEVAPESGVSVGLGSSSSEVPPDAGKAILYAVGSVVPTTASTKSDGLDPALDKRIQAAVGSAFAENLPRTVIAALAVGAVAALLVLLAVALLSGKGRSSGRPKGRYPADAETPSAGPQLRELRTSLDKLDQRLDSLVSSVLPGMLKQTVSAMESTAGGVQSPIQDVSRSLRDLAAQNASAAQRADAQVKETAELAVMELSIKLERLEGSTASQLDTQTRLIERIAANSWPPFEPGEPDLAVRARKLLEFCNTMEQPPGHTMEGAFFRQCAKELENLVVIAGKLQAGAGAYSETDIEFLLPRVYLPSRVVDVAQLSRTAAAMGMTLQLRMDDLRRGIKDRVASSCRIVAIEPIPGSSVFDPTMHEDQDVYRLPAKSERDHNLIYAVLSPGFKDGLKVVRKAQVKRYVASAPGVGSAGYSPGQPSADPFDSRAPVQSSASIFPEQGGERVEPRERPAIPTSAPYSPSEERDEPALPDEEVDSHERPEPAEPDRGARPVDPSPEATPDRNKPWRD